jgi:single-strand DNA-binding protein
MLTMQVIGNLGADPEDKTSSGGTRFCRFSLASNKKVKGEKVTTWINVTVFDEKKIDFLINYVRKGTRLFVEGEPAARAYEQNGEVKASLDMILGYNSKIEICSSEPAGDGGAERAQAGASGASAASHGGTAAADVDDDIPW